MLVLGLGDGFENQDIMNMRVSGLSNNEIGILLHQNEAEQINKAIKSIIWTHFPHKWSKNHHNHNHMFPILFLRFFLWFFLFCRIQDASWCFECFEMENQLANTVPWNAKIWFSCKLRFGRGPRFAKFWFSCKIRFGRRARFSCKIRFGRRAAGERKRGPGAQLGPGLRLGGMPPGRAQRQVLMRSSRVGGGPDGYTIDSKEVRGRAPLILFRLRGGDWIMGAHRKVKRPYRVIY